MRRFLQGASLSCHLFAVRRQKTGELVMAPTLLSYHLILLLLKQFHFHQSAFQNWPAARMRPLLRCHLEIPKNCQISHGRRRLTEIRAVTWWRRQNSSANRQTKPGGDLIGKKHLLVIILIPLILILQKAIGSCQSTLCHLIVQVRVGRP